MNNLDEKPASKWIVILTALSFSFIGLGALYIAVDTTRFLIIGIYNSQDNIEFNKGALYLYGVSLILLIFVVGIIYTNYLKKNISNHTNKIIGKVVLVCLIITFLLPQIVHYATANYLENNGYQVCEARSKQWLHVRTIVYSKLVSCDEDKY